jgi:hypothetical protein
MGNTPTSFVGGSKEDKITIDKVFERDLLSDLRLVSGYPWNIHAHFTINVVCQAGTVKGIRTFFCPYIRFVQVLTEKFLYIFSVGFAGFCGFDDLIVGVRVFFGTAGEYKER